jgi:hypothetical protein
MRTNVATCGLLSVLIGVIASSNCRATYAMSPERAAVERAAIHHDLRHDTSTLYAIASKRAKMAHPDLANRSIVCAISNIDIHFTSERRAIYTAAYACGIAPWQLGPAVATPTIALDVLKHQGGPWFINGFL